MEKRSHFLFDRPLQPAVMMLRQSEMIKEDAGIRPFQMIIFTTTRSVSKAVFKIDKEMDGVIYFRCPRIDTGKSYQLEIRAFDNSSVFLDEQFDSFDENKTARLIYPFQLMKTGDYSLLILEPGNNQQNILCKYEFSIE